MRKMNSRLWRCAGWSRGQRYLSVPHPWYRSKPRPTPAARNAAFGPRFCDALCCLTVANAVRSVHSSVFVWTRLARAAHGHEACKAACHVGPRPYRPPHIRRSSHAFVPHGACVHLRRGRLSGLWPGRYALRGLDGPDPRAKCAQRVADLRPLGLVPLLFASQAEGEPSPCADVAGESAVPAQL